MFVLNKQAMFVLNYDALKVHHVDISIALPADQCGRGGGWGGGGVVLPTHPRTGQADLENLQVKAK